MRTPVMGSRAWRLSFLLLLLTGLLAGCRASRGFTNTTVASSARRASIPVPPGQAVFVAFHGVGDESNIVLFTSDGTPVCQVPSGAHCAMALTPGQYRIYIAWSRGFVDAWDLDVVEGRTYFATMSAPRGGWGSFIDEKLTPESPHWGRLAEYMSGVEVGLDPRQAATLQLELGDYTQLVRAGDSRMARYDARHVEAHTIHPDDGVVLP